MKKQLINVALFQRFALVVSIVDIRDVNLIFSEKIEENLFAKARDP